MRVLRQGERKTLIEICGIQREWKKNTRKKKSKRESQTDHLSLMRHAHLFKNTTDRARQRIRDGRENEKWRHRRGGKQVNSQTALGSLWPSLFRDWLGRSSRQIKDTITMVLDTSYSFPSIHPFHFLGPSSPVPLTGHSSPPHHPHWIVKLKKGWHLAPSLRTHSTQMFSV